ncbi:MAG: GLPGLI family protein [Bacteroidales bacterium]
MKHFLSILFLTYFSCISISAQDRFFYLGQPYTYKDSVLLDHSHLNLIYRHEFRQNTMSQPMWSNIKIQIGKKVIKQMDMHIHICNLWRKISEESPGIIPNKKELALYGDCNHPYFSEVISFIKEDSIRVTCCNFLLAANYSPLVYYELTPKMDWILLNDVDTVAGYSCKTALTHFRGRVWKVWYAQEIPIMTGPWKLCGLPGVILRAIDEEKTYSFECTEINTTPQLIYDYIPTTVKYIKRHQYLIYEQRYHKDPQSIRADGIDIFKSDQEGVKKIDAPWQILYSPIEFE